MIKAVYLKEFGGPENLEIREIAEPGTPGTGQVLVRVFYAGVNRADILQRRGLYPGPKGYDPHRPGLEFAGIVEAVGDDVDQFLAGEQVMGITSGEAQSELILVDHRHAISADGLSPEQAGAIPEVYVTAHDALVTQANVAAGESVLIHAIASGVGLAGAQIAKAKGARVIGTTRSPEKAAKLSDANGEFSRWIDHVIVTDEGPLFADKVLELTVGHGADVVIDLVGGDYFPEELRAAASKGRIILVGLTAGRKAEFDMGLALAKRVTIKGTVLRSRSNDEKAAAVKAMADDLLPWFPDGELRPIVDRIFPIEEVADAHRYVESDMNIGKVLLAFPHV